MRHIILISGKDSLATALLQTERRPDLAYEFLFNDVEAELPETYAWIEQVEKKTGWPIVRVGKSLPEGIRSYGGFLPAARARYCTVECKIEPLQKYLGQDDATVYFGLRADEGRIGFVPKIGSNITPNYPLREAGVTIDGVYEILDKHGISPPNFFWPRLYEAVAAKLENWGGWSEKLTRFEFDALFSGRSRGNCYFCFFQRQYEYLWLSETHPDLFEQAHAFEKDDYTWRQEYDLSYIVRPEIAQRIFDRRIADVVKAVTQKFQTGMFDEWTDNVISVTSCGLLCGK